MTEAEFHERVRKCCIGVEVFVDRKLVQVCSGFLVELYGIWYWVTAGHVFDEVDRQIGSTSDYVLKWLVLDNSLDKTYFSYKPGMPIRFDHLGTRILESGRPLDEGNRQVLSWLSECDIGMLTLSEMDRDLLASYGLEPLTKPDVVAFDSNTLATFQALRWDLLLAGIPREGIHVDEDPAKNQMSFLTLPVCLPDPPTTATGSYPPFFTLAPAWSSELFDGDVKGMSGGPILAAADGHFRMAGILSGRLGNEGRRPKTLTVVAADMFFFLMDELCLRHRSEHRDAATAP